MKTLALTNHLGKGIKALLMALTLLGTLAGTAHVKAASHKAAGASIPSYPVRVSANGRYLVDRNNVPFLIAGDNPHALVTMITVKEAAHYFADREAHGFNAAWMDVLVAGPYRPYSPANGATYDGILPFTGYVAGGKDTAHYDLTKPNEAYFTRVDQMLTLAAAHRILVFLDPIETGQWVPTLRNNGLSNAATYGRYLGNRYKHFHNILWLSGNDFETWENPNDDALVQAVAKGIKATDPDALQTVELNYQNSSSFDDPTWVPLIQINGTYAYAATYIQMLHSYNQTPIAPTYLLEAHYELEKVGEPWDYGNPPVLRRQEYWAMLTGGTGQLYGNAFIWTFMPGWQYYLDTEGVTQLIIWKNFFESMPWQDLVPDQTHTVITAGYGTFGDMQTRVYTSDYCTASKTPDGSYVLAYMPTVRTIAVNMANLKARAIAKWFDPSNGAYATISGGPFANSGTREFTPPGKNHDGNGDWVLLLEASGSTH
ncbi:MAG: DUF4038 domain-containing protein [Terracidiphilus sp.]